MRAENINTKGRNKLLKFGTFWYVLQPKRVYKKLLQKKIAKSWGTTRLCTFTLSVMKKEERKLKISKSIDWRSLISEENNCLKINAIHSAKRRKISKIGMPKYLFIHCNLNKVFFIFSFWTIHIDDSIFESIKMNNHTL